MRRKILLLFTLCSASPLAFSQESDNDGKPDYARTPQEIAFQNDSQWEDNRWQQMEVGPFLAATVDTHGGKTLKGLTIRVGDRQQATVCFDTARLRLSAAWTGGFLEFDGRRFGVIRHPKAAGELIFQTPRVAGWANGQRFEPTVAEFTLPGENPKQSVVHLPKDWAAWRGFHTHDDRVVLSYTVGQTGVLESPWYVQVGEDGALVRSFEAGPSDKPLRLWAGEKNVRVTVIGQSGAHVDSASEQVVIVPPHNKQVRFKVVLTPHKTPEETVHALREAAGQPDDLSALLASDKGRYPQVLMTEGSTTEDGGPYVIDTLTLPFENPWNALLFTSGHDFFSDGSAAVCTLHGDVWTVSGIDRNLRQLRWRRFATGLYQPLGLKIVDDTVYVICHDQITRLHDRNGDGEADFYENFNNDQIATVRTHDFVTCLDTDPQGNFYFIHGKTGVMRVSRDGTTLTQVADGLRNPNGMTVGPDGTITAAPQQGAWTPESSLILVKDGGYYGYGGPRVTDERPDGWDRPLCFIPRAMDNSGGAQVWVDSDRWGPLNGQLLHFSYGQCRMLLALREDVNGVAQGGTIKFPTTPGDFESGAMRGRFSPHDGQLYVSGLRGWQTRSVRDGCLQRVRYVGGALHLPVGVKTFSNGMRLTFSDPIDSELAQNPENYLVQQWNYLWSKEYGSPEFSVANPNQQGRDDIPVESVTLLEDGRSVFLEMPGREPVMQISMSYLLRSTGGRRFEGTYAHTINTRPTEAFPESRIVRRKRIRRIAAEVEERLKPGIEFRFRDATGKVDSRSARLVELRQEIDEAPTPFLQRGPFSLAVHGTLKMPLSGFYEFKLEGSGAALVRLNGMQLVTLGEQTTEPVLVHQGHNPFQIEYDSPQTESARLGLWWKGYNFDWEPVPADLFFHDSGSAELTAGQSRRDGRNTFANKMCAHCHRTTTNAAAMFELGLAAPDLLNAGDRFTEDWLQNWILSPHALRPKTTMPSVLGSGEQARQYAADLAAYLAAQRDSTGTIEPEQAEAAVSTGNRVHAASGEALFEQLGCINCHHFAIPASGDEWNRLSLHSAAAKFKPNALASFLRNPTAHDTATRMPAFRLSLDEAHALAIYVREKSTGSLAEPFPAGNAARGRNLFTEAGCRQCHAIGAQQSTGIPQIVWKSVVEPTGCLVESASSEFGIPHFDFSDAERVSLLNFLKTDLGSLNHTDQAETSARLVERLRCTSCHDRDGMRSHRLLVVAEEGSGQLPEAIPALTRAGEKLQPQWTESLLAGELNYRPRPWLNSRMPAFPAYATALAHGLAAEHGVAPNEPIDHSYDAELVDIGEQLTRQTALDCRQCHGIRDQQPRGDKNTQIARASTSPGSAIACGMKPICVSCLIRRGMTLTLA